MCDIGSCHRVADYVIDHPGRPESETRVCQRHAMIVDEAWGDLEVVRWV